MTRKSSVTILQRINELTPFTDVQIGEYLVTYYLSERSRNPIYSIRLNGEVIAKHRTAFRVAQFLYQHVSQ